MMTLSVWLPGPVFLPGVFVHDPMFLSGGLPKKGVSVEGDLPPRDLYWGSLFRSLCYM